MPRIQQLSPLVVNKIAAGEVIERPSSVVKELLENSVDAGSTRIDVDVEQGGTELIRIVDDGCGIHPDDLALAFASHATSKLHSADDLFRIGTLGFRGEALASVGGVAQVTLQSRQPDQTSGAQITCNGGEMSNVQPWNGSPGTRIEVRHLFYNTPVRRKFLRTTSTEMGHISEQFTRLALAHARPPFAGNKPDSGLHLTLRHNNKPVFDVKRTTSLIDRIGLFFGPEIANQLYGVQAARGPATLTGYIADPACERGTAKLQYLFLNGRWIRADRRPWPCRARSVSRPAHDRPVCRCVPVPRSAARSGGRQRTSDQAGGSLPRRPGALPSRFLDRARTVACREPDGPFTNTFDDPTQRRDRAAGLAAVGAAA